MKEVYEIIIEKLQKDFNKTVNEINDIIEEVEYNELYKMRYERLVGAKNYCKDLIEFFSEALKHVN